MWSRRRIDIGWSDLLVAPCYRFGDRQRVQRNLEARFSAAGDALACLSVRSGFDLLFSSCRFPPGSEILMSAITIEDMATIVRHHDCVPVPVDLDPTTMSARPEQWESRVTPRTRAVVFAHLFGTVHDTGPLVQICRRHGLLLIEDAAQAFAGSQFRGHPDADVVMFSFGPIKTATALGGGLLIVRDQQRLHDMRSTLMKMPVQRENEFLHRVSWYAFLKLVSSRSPFASLVRLCELFGQDASRVLNQTARNFPRGELFTNLRKQPSTTLLQMMQRRISRFDPTSLQRRSRLGRLFLQSYGQACQACLPVIYSADAEDHTWWAVPVGVNDRSRAEQAFRREGFDVAVASQLRAIEPTDGHPAAAAVQAMEFDQRVLYLPLYEAMPDHEIVRMAEVLRTHSSADAPSTAES